MKKALLILIAVFCIFTTNAYADQLNYGCGLGTMLFGSSDSLAIQIIAASVNQCFGTQAFGISSGTSNCEKPESLVFNKKVNTFVAENMDSLAGDMARGQGEHLNTLAALIGIPKEERPAFYNRVQKNFSSIFPSDKVTGQEVVQNIQALM